MNKLKQTLLSHNFVFGFFVLTALVISIHSYLLPPRDVNGVTYTHYNNFLIFKSSFAHLLHHEDLYTTHNADHFDYYKYSPSFAFLMFPFHPLPDFVGLVLWNLLNALFVFFAIKYFPNVNDRTKALILWFVLLELIGSIQNTQSNGIMAGLFVAGFIFMERNQTAMATLALVLSAFLKPFGLVGFSLFLVYPGKLKFALYSALWFVLIFVLPLLVVDWHYLPLCYRGWLELLQWDQSASIGMSLAGLLQALSPVEVPKSLLLVAGVALFCAPLLNFKAMGEFRYRLLLLASILIWVIIFNHKAESPTYIIAMCGIALWYFTGKKTRLALVLLVLAFVLSSLSPTEIFPKIVRDTIVNPYSLKALPAVVIWFVVLYEMAFRIKPAGNEGAKPRPVSN